ncbi:MAG: carbohydrate ABC transporter permease [Firmicutes bacterium]|nr:carbohydrate ABC transporter permease [Bacillota bacterium]
MGMRTIIMKVNTRRYMGELSIHVLLIIFCIYSILPILWVTVSSLKPESDLFQWPPRWLPKGLYLENFRLVLGQTDVTTTLVNSVIVSSISALTVMIAGALGAYAIGRLRFRGRDLILLAILATQMIPSLTNIVPIYLMLSKVRMIDTRTSLVLVYTGMNIPLSIWILIGFMQSIPRELEEAAMIDGCTRLSSFARVIIPLCLPGLAAVTILTFVIAWNEFVMALVLISSKELLTYQVGLYNFMLTQAGYFNQWAQLNAVAVLGLIPTFIGYLSVQKYFVAGLMRGAIK